MPFWVRNSRTTFASLSIDIHDAPAINAFAEPFQAGHFSVTGRTPSRPHIKYQQIVTESLNKYIDTTD